MPMSEQFFLRAKHVRRMVRLARRAGSRETCGVLVGQVAPARVIEMQNAAGDNGEFLFDTDEQLKIWQGPEQIFAIWHSHPAGAAEPSGADRSCMELHPDQVHIIATRSGVQGYRFRNGRVVAVELVTL